MAGINGQGNSYRVVCQEDGLHAVHNVFPDNRIICCRISAEIPKSPSPLTLGSTRVITSQHSTEAANYSFFLSGNTKARHE